MVKLHRFELLLILLPLEQSFCQIQDEASFTEMLIVKLRIAVTIVAFTIIVASIVVIIITVA